MFDLYRFDLKPMTRCSSRKYSITIYTVYIANIAFLRKKKKVLTYDYKRWDERVFSKVLNSFHGFGTGILLSF